MSKQDAYSLYRHINRKFKRHKVIARGIDYQWDIDIGFMDKYQKWNNGYKYIILTIDVFSICISTKPLKTKSGNEVSKVLKEIFDENNPKPGQIRSNEGTEFVNKIFSGFSRKEKYSFLLPNQQRLKQISQNVE